MIIEKIWSHNSPMISTHLWWVKHERKWFTRAHGKSKKVTRFSSYINPHAPPIPSIQYSPKGPICQLNSSFFTSRANSIVYEKPADTGHCCWNNKHDHSSISAHQDEDMEDSWQVHLVEQGGKDFFQWFSNWCWLFFVPRGKKRAWTKMLILS